MPRFYAGIGARATPPEILSLMTRATHGVPVFNLQRERERTHVERHLVL